MTFPAANHICGLARFRPLWQRCLIDGVADNSTAIHQRLVSGYQETQRHYHTLVHIEHCLTMFDRCRSQTSNPDAIEIAIWFHDVIFEPGSQDNEAHSAELYLELSAGIHTAELRDSIAHMTMATLHDGSSLEDDDSRYMVDIDLSSFGLPWTDFLRDSNALRAENPQLSDAEYYRNQQAFQSGLLARKRFFLTDFFYHRFELQARDNLARYFEHIRKLG